MSDLSKDRLLFLSELVAEMVRLRLEAGHHPDDVILSAWDIYEATSRVFLDGSWPNG